MNIFGCVVVCGLKPVVLHTFSIVYYLLDADKCFEISFNEQNNKKVKHTFSTVNIGPPNVVEFIEKMGK